jgi:hypothetical protein
MDETIVAETPIGEGDYSRSPCGHECRIIWRPCLTDEESEHFRTRWNEIQGKFVDEPRSAVQQADALVSEVIEQIT